MKEESSNNNNNETFSDNDQPLTQEITMRSMDSTNSNTSFIIDPYETLIRETIDHNTFHTRRTTLKLRLSGKQRMHFNDLVHRGFRGPLKDEFNEFKPIERSKKILQLSRRVSGRPFPFEIQTDPELPPDLKKADLAYHQLYGSDYRIATEADEIYAQIEEHMRTSSDPNPKQKQRHRRKLSHQEEDSLCRQFKQRSQLKELTDRGILPPEYAEVVIGTKNVHEALAEYKRRRSQASIQISNKIDPKFRPSATDLQNRHIVPHGAFESDDPREMSQAQIQERSKNVEAFQRYYQQRITPTEAGQRNIIDPQFLFGNIEYNEYVDNQQMTKKENERVFATKYSQRATPNEIIQRGIVKHSEFTLDHEKVERELQLAKDHLSLKLQAHLNSRPQPSNKRVSELGYHYDPEPLTDNEYIISNESLENTLQVSIIGRIEDELDDTISSDDSLNIDFSLGSFGFTSFLDRMNQERTQTEKVLIQHHKRRPSKDDLEQRGIVPIGYFKNSDKAMMKVRTRRLSVTSELAKFFNQRPDLAHLLAAGLLKADVIDVAVNENTNEFELKEIKKRKKKEKKKLKKLLDTKLHPKSRPSRNELEMRGVVPEGYFTDASEAVQGKHIRRMTAEKELSQFLPARINPHMAMTSGKISATYYNDIMGISLNAPPTMGYKEMMLHSPRESDEDRYYNDERSKYGQIPNKTQQAFANSAMGVGMIYSQKLVKAMLTNDNTGDARVLKSNASLDKQPGIHGVVLQLPHIHTFADNHWTHELYASLISSLNFTQITRRINAEIESQHKLEQQKKKMLENVAQLNYVMKVYQEFERNYHTNISQLQNERKGIIERLNRAKVEEEQNIKILTQLSIEHSQLDQKIRPQMKMLLHKMTLVETRVSELESYCPSSPTPYTFSYYYSSFNPINEKYNREKLKAEYEHELQYYYTYITELKNMFVHTNDTRTKYKNQIHMCMSNISKLEKKLKIKEEEIEQIKIELSLKLKEFHLKISKISSINKHFILQSQFDIFEPEMKYNTNDTHSHDNIMIYDIQRYLELKNKKLDEQLDLLSFRISTIPATDYALRVLELCQLSFIYGNEQLKSYFEWFVKFANQIFSELLYAYTMYKVNNHECIQGLSSLQSIKYISNLTSESTVAVDVKIKCIIDYLLLLPIDEERDSVIFHVSRNLAGNVNRSRVILGVDEQEIPTMAREDVKLWIGNILISGGRGGERDIIHVTRMDSVARVKPSRAAAIVLDHVYGIHVHG